MDESTPSPLNLDAIARLMRACANRNHGLTLEGPALSSWLDGCASVTVFGDTEGVVALGRRGELGFIVDPHAPAGVLRRMYRFIATLSVPCYAHILLGNREVLSAATRLGFAVIGGTDRSVLMRRN